jgi:hypothetical protein
VRALLYFYKVSHLEKCSAVNQFTMNIRDSLKAKTKNLCGKVLKGQNIFGFKLMSGDPKTEGMLAKRKTEKKCAGWAEARTEKVGVEGFSC